MGDPTYELGDRAALDERATGAGTSERPAPDMASAGIPPSRPRRRRCSRAFRPAYARPRRWPAPAPGSVPAAGARAARDRRSEEELLALRDEIGEARLEDVPAAGGADGALAGGVADARRAADHAGGSTRRPTSVTCACARRVAGRGEVERDVFIGRATFTDPKARVTSSTGGTLPSASSITATRGRRLRGDVRRSRGRGRHLQRRTVTIEDGALLRVACPQGIWIRHKDSRAAGVRRR